MVAPGCCAHVKRDAKVGPAHALPIGFNAN
jgi:hypothetical protein